MAAESTRCVAARWDAPDGHAKEALDRGGRSVPASRCLRAQLVDVDRSLHPRMDGADTCSVDPAGAEIVALIEASGKRTRSRPPRRVPDPGVHNGNRWTVGIRGMGRQDRVADGAVEDVIDRARHVAAATTLIVCGSPGVVFSDMTVSPCLTDSGPGVKRSVAMILTFGTNCSLPAARTVRPVAALVDPAIAAPTSTTRDTRPRSRFMRRPSFPRAVDGSVPPAAQNSRRPKPGRRDTASVQSKVYSTN